ncbi:trp operon leader peptide [Streptomyces vastus]
MRRIRRVEYARDRPSAWDKVPHMFAHSTQKQNWWWTAYPAAH